MQLTGKVYLGFVDQHCDLLSEGLRMQMLAMIVSILTFLKLLNLMTNILRIELTIVVGFRLVICLCPSVCENDWCVKQLLSRAGGINSSCVRCYPQWI